MDIKKRIEHSVVNVAKRLKVAELNFDVCQHDRKASVRVGKSAKRLPYDALGAAIARSVIKDVPSLKRVSVTIKADKHEKRYRMDKPCGCKHDSAKKKTAAKKAR